MEDAVVIMDRDDPGRSRGFGFVTLPNMEAAENVMKSTDGQDLMVSHKLKLRRYTRADHDAHTLIFTGSVDPG